MDGYTFTSKHRDDSYYFHYDLGDKKLGTVRIENLINISINRIKEPYFVKNKIATISKKDNDEIIKIIKKYYAFEDVDTIKDSKKNIVNKVEPNTKKIVSVS